MTVNEPVWFLIQAFAYGFAAGLGVGATLRVIRFFFPANGG